MENHVPTHASQITKNEQNPRRHRDLADPVGRQIRWNAPEGIVMNRAVKIAVIAGSVVAAVFAAIFVGPVLAMIVLGSYAGLVISVTPDAAFEEEFAQIPEVKLFITEYPDYSTSHSGDFLGWKVITYFSDGEPTVVMGVRKSVLDGDVRVSAGCDYGAHRYSLDVPREGVADLIARGCGQA